MILKEVISMANHAELKQISIDDDNSSVLSYINLGMIELYKRFVLSTQEVIIDIGRVTTDNDDYKMVSESMYMMPNDYMYIVAAYEESGKQLPINDENDINSVNSVSWNMIQIPNTINRNKIAILYNNTPKTLTKSDLNKYIPLPPQLIEALLHYVGYRAYSSIDGGLDKENNAHYQRFERSCKNAIDLGLFTADGLESALKLGMRGFV